MESDHPEPTTPRTPIRSRPSVEGLPSHASSSPIPHAVPGFMMASPRGLEISDHSTRTGQHTLATFQEDSSLITQPLKTPTVNNGLRNTVSCDTNTSRLKRSFAVDQGEGPRGCQLENDEQETTVNCPVDNGPVTPAPKTRRLHGRSSAEPETLEAASPSHVYRTPGAPRRRGNPGVDALSSQTSPKTPTPNMVARTVGRNPVARSSQLERQRRREIAARRRAFAQTGV